MSKQCHTNLLSVNENAKIQKCIKNSKIQRFGIPQIQLTGPTLTAELHSYSPERIGPSEFVFALIAAIRAEQQQKFACGTTFFHFPVHNEIHVNAYAYMYVCIVYI